jgi:hypothetical protein
MPATLPKARSIEYVGTAIASWSNHREVYSVALGINDKGQIVGLSLSSFSADGILRASVRQNGKLVDLNSRIAGSTALSLLTACSINSRGEIIVEIYLGGSMSREEYP